jgi:succinoglycan biosynthesis transport protein ExoP
MNDPNRCLLGPEPRRSAYLEAYRALRTNILIAAEEKPVKTLLVTSARTGEGKSTVAANLATVTALGGKQAILVDGDLRHPVLAGVFDTGPAHCFGDVLLGHVPVDQALCETEVPGLRLLPGRPEPTDAPDLLLSPHLRAAAARIRSVWRQRNAGICKTSSTSAAAAT